MQDYQQDKNTSPDRLETMQPAGQALPTDSPSAAVDAGLDDATQEELGAEPVAQANVMELPADEREIPMTDLADALPATELQSPELSDLNAPGEVDIEDLDEDALSDTDIPRDALLDPLED